MHREDQFIPELIVRNGPAALDFYKSVFGAEEVHRMVKPGSEKLVHGELTLDGHKFFVCDEFPASEGGTCQSPETLRGTGVRITLLVDNADCIRRERCMSEVVKGCRGNSRLGRAWDI
jgi:PhnB protein